MVNENGLCPIWKVHCALSGPYDAPGIWCVEGSLRAGGDYEITPEARYEVGNLSDQEKARVTSILVEQWMKGVKVPRLTASDVQRAKHRTALPTLERADRLLRLLIKRTSQLGEILDFIDPRDRRSAALNGLDIERFDTSQFEHALAWSESNSSEELAFLTEHMAAWGWITKGREIQNSQNTVITRTEGSYVCRVEVAGYARVEELVTSIDSSQCFVAMWFDESMHPARDEGIKPAIENAGYTPMVIDQKPDLIGKIEDAIISEIRRSKFMVADFTHGEEGVRGSVYYEAGFAHALGLPVIFTRRKDKQGVVHFDTDHFYRIEWDTPEDLRKQLKVKIEAAFGEGPLKNQISPV